MGKKYKNLIDEIASMPNLYRSYEKAAKGKRYSCGHLQFKQHLAANLRALSVALRNGTYRPSAPNVFFVNEPKRREISALPFADRVVQHALCAVIEPLFDRVFLPPTGRGLPIGNLTSQLFANVYGHVLDRYLTHTLRIKTWLRYMDDTVVFAHSREALALLQQGLKWFCEARIGLRFSKWSIGHISQGLDWLGYRIWPTHKLLRKHR